MVKRKTNIVKSKDTGWWMAFGKEENVLGRLWVEV